MFASLLIFAAVAIGPDAGDLFAWVDATSHQGRDVLNYRAVVLRNEPPMMLEIDGDSDRARWRYGMVLVGSSPRTALALVCAPGSEAGGRIGVDGNGDGRIAADEWYTLTGDGGVDCSAAVRIAPEDTPGSNRPADDIRTLVRTLIVQRDREGELRYAVRGCRAGRLTLGGASHAALLADGDADGLFHHAGKERLWIDLDNDGSFDPFVEQFALGRPVRVQGAAWIVSADPTGELVSARGRSEEMGELRVTLGVASSARPERVAIALVSDLGELVTIDKLDEPVKLPAGEYWASDLSLDLRDKEGALWHYMFSGRRGQSAKVTAAEAARLVLLDGLELDFESKVPAPPRAADGRGAGRRGAKPADPVAYTPRLSARTGLELRGMTVQVGRRQPNGRAAELTMTYGGGRSLRVGNSGFV